MDEYIHNADDYPWQGRAVMLVDLDAFFASVEQLDHPQWRGKPVIVGGDADRRGVVFTCSYEARAFGVRSAMASATAKRLCPHAIWTHGRYARYRELSNQVMQILKDETPFMQQVSIDEAFLDITPGAYGGEHPVAVARRIRERVRQLGITCSVGLGVSKSVAKVASDMDKPDGLTVVYPGREADFLAPLPTKVMSGIGPVAQKRLAQLGIMTLGQVAAADDDVLGGVFGVNARMMRNRCLGADDDPVHDDDTAKSISNEISFADDLTERRDVEAALGTVAAKVARRLRKNGLLAGTVTLKVRYANLSIRTEARQLTQPTDDERVFADALVSMIDDLWAPGMPVRLLGMAATRLGKEKEGYVQEALFVDEHDEANVAHARQMRGLERATDRVRDRFGESAVMFGREMHTLSNLTGSGTKNPADYKPVQYDDPEEG